MAAHLQVKGQEEFAELLHRLCHSVVLGGSSRKLRSLEPGFVDLFVGFVGFYVGFVGLRVIRLV